MAELRISQEVQPCQHYCAHPFLLAADCSLLADRVVAPAPPNFAPVPPTPEPTAKKTSTKKATANEKPAAKTTAQKAVLNGSDSDEEEKAAPTRQRTCQSELCALVVLVNHLAD